jgi:hypothetical protein
MEVNTSSTLDTQDLYNYINGFLMNPSAFIIVSIVIVAYLIFFSSLGNSKSNSTMNLSGTGDNDSSGTMKIVITIIVVMLIVLVLANGFQYFFGLDIIASVKNIFLGNPLIDIKVINDSVDNSGNYPDDNTNDNDGDIDYSFSRNNTIRPSSSIPEIVSHKQVFNIPGNNYSYKDAEAVCGAFGSRLASYSEIEDSYSSGGEWCNYGWSKGQMALYPTQKSTYNNLQKIEGHEHDCGRPGVNGGYMANPNIKYGINCYGYKPKMDSEEEEMMQHTSPYPKTKKDILMEKRVDYWKNNISDILVSPFNHNNWSDTGV